MNFGIELREAEKQIRIYRLADLLVTRYAKVGSMTVILRDGRTVSDRPVYSTLLSEYERNIKLKAEELARLAVESSPKPFSLKEYHELSPSRF